MQIDGVAVPANGSASVHVDDTGPNV